MKEDKTTFGIRLTIMAIGLNMFLFAGALFFDLMEVSLPKIICGMILVVYGFIAGIILFCQAFKIK